MRRVASISIDLDDVAAYQAIHQVAPSAGTEPQAVYEHCVPRWLSWLSEQDLRATFFVIGSSLENPKNAELIRSLHARGHEIANHSYSHAYDLTRRIRKDIQEDIERCSAIIDQTVGKPPRGFRAPGYVVTDPLFEVLDALRLNYDSSVFPCPTYYSAKLAALGWMALRGRSSASIVDHPGVFLASRSPYRVGTPYWKRGTGVVELPIGVTSVSSGALPFIGTSLILAGPAGARWLTRRMIGQPFVNLELHGIDLADADADGLAHLKPHQPDLRVSLTRKLRSLSAAVRTLRRAGYIFVTLEEAAARYAHASR